MEPGLVNQRKPDHSEPRTSPRRLPMLNPGPTLQQDPFCGVKRFDFDRGEHALWCDRLPIGSGW
jgi:hypothetical protein